MRHRILFLVMAVAALLAMTAGSALAAVPGTLDSQQTDVSGGLLPQAMLAQTFVPTISGSLDAVEVYTSFGEIATVAAAPNDVPDITVQITGTASDLPTSTILASETVAPADGDWAPVVFSAPTNVVAGTKYAILVSQDAATGSTEWNGACGSDPYGPGEALIFDSTWQSIGTFFAKSCLTDFAFRTYITAPTPTPVPTVSPSPFQSVQGATAAPTPPPTNTGDSGSADNSGYLLVFVGLATGAALLAFASTSRRRHIRR